MDNYFRFGNFKKLTVFFSPSPLHLVNTFCYRYHLYIGFFLIRKELHYTDIFALFLSFKLIFIGYITFYQGTANIEMIAFDLRQNKKKSYQNV